MNRDIYVTDGTLTICPASENDRGFLHNISRNMTKLAESLSVIGLEMKISVSVDGINYSIFDENDKYCGNIVIENPSSATPEIGIDLIKSRRNKGIALRATRLVAKKFYEDNNVEYFIIKALAENTHSRHVIEKSGAVFCCMEKAVPDKAFEAFTEAVDKMEDEAIKSVLKKEMKNYEERYDDVYVYKLMPEAFT